MRHTCIIIFFLSVLTLNGQDNICKLADGYFGTEAWAKNRSEIKFILPGYGNSHLQIIKEKELPGLHFSNDNNLPGTYQSLRCIPLDTNRIYKTSKGYIYKNREISNKEILSLLRDLPCIEKQKEMIPLHKKLRRNDRNRLIFALSGVAMIPIGGLPALALTSLGQGETAATVGVAYLGIGSVLVIVSQICNFNYHTGKKRLVNKYNDF